MNIYDSCLLVTEKANLLDRYLQLTSSYLLYPYTSCTSYTSPYTRLPPYISVELPLPTYASLDIPVVSGNSVYTQHSLFDNVGLWRKFGFLGNPNKTSPLLVVFGIVKAMQFVAIYFGGRRSRDRGSD